MPPRRRFRRLEEVARDLPGNLPSMLPFTGRSRVPLAAEEPLEEKKKVQPIDGPNEFSHPPPLITTMDLLYALAHKGLEEGVSLAELTAIAKLIEEALEVMMSYKAAMEGTALRAKLKVIQQGFKEVVQFEENDRVAKLGNHFISLKEALEEEFNKIVKEAIGSDQMDNIQKLCAQSNYMKEALAEQYFEASREGTSLRDDLKVVHYKIREAVETKEKKRIQKLGSQTKYLKDALAENYNE